MSFFLNAFTINETLFLEIRIPELMIIHIDVVFKGNVFRIFTFEERQVEQLLKGAWLISC